MPIQIKEYLHFKSNMCKKYSKTQQKLGIKLGKFTNKNK